MELMWHLVSNPIAPEEHIPAERKTVLVWLRDTHQPFCGYIRYAAGDLSCPYFVVYHGNTNIGADVVAWCDCLPDAGPPIDSAKMYTKWNRTGRGVPERPASDANAARSSRPQSPNAADATLAAASRTHRSTRRTG